MHPSGAIRIIGAATGAANILTNRPALDAVAEAFAERAVSHRFLTPQEQVAENLLLLQVEFLKQSLS